MPPISSSLPQNNVSTTDTPLITPILELENKVKILPSQPHKPFLQFLKVVSRVATASVLLILVTAGLMLGWHFFMGIQTGLYNFKFGLTHFILFTLMTAGVMVLSIWTSIYLRDLHRKYMEAALKESEERYRLVVEGSNEGIWDWDIQKNHTYWNHRFFEILGITPCDELVTQGIFGERLHPEDRSNVWEALSRHLAQKGPYEVPLRLLASSGEYRHCLSRGKAIFDENGKPVRMSGMLIDLTPQKQLEQQLAQAKEQAERVRHRKDRWVASLSQELVISLNHVMGYSQMLQSANDGNLTPQQEKYTAHIIESGQLVLNTLNSLLQISRIDLGEIRPTPEIIPVKDFIKTLESMVQEFALSRKVMLQFDIDPNLTTLYADRENLKQILVNLLSNGIKFNKPGGIVNLRIFNAPDEQEIVYQVEDTGCGIPQHKLTDLFQDFYKHDSLASTAETESLPGLGLVYSGKLVELMGGSISVESTEGIGSIFTFRLPASETQSPD